MSDVVAGVAWAADAAYDAAQLKVAGKNRKHKGSVANMSLGGGKSQALDDAVNSAVEDGLHFAVAVSFAASRLRAPRADTTRSPL